MYKFTELHAGHFLASRSNGILFDERGCHAQCFHCNIELEGNYPKYLAYMMQRYGQEVIDNLHFLKSYPVQLKQWQYHEIARSLRKKYKELQNAQVV